VYLKTDMARAVGTLPTFSRDISQAPPGEPISVADPTTEVSTNLIWWDPDRARSHPRLGQIGQRDRQMETLWTDETDAIHTLHT